MRIRFGTTNPDSPTADIVASGEPEIGIHGLAATIVLKQGAHMGIVTLTNNEIELLAAKAGILGHAVREKATRD